MKSRPQVDLTIYVKAFGLLVRHPSIFVMPLLAAVVELLLTQLSYLFTDPLGGSGAGIFQMLVQLVYLWNHDHSGECRLAGAPRRVR
jgi:hypothetical protein